MPVYTSVCHSCGEEHTYVKSIASRLETPVCCNEATEKVIDAVRIGAQSGSLGYHITDGKNGGKGTWIETGQDLKRYVKQNNLMQGREGTQEAAVQRKNLDAAEKKKIRKAAEAAVIRHMT